MDLRHGVWAPAATVCAATEHATLKRRRHTIRWETHSGMREHPRKRTTALPASFGYGPSPGFGPSPPPRSAFEPDVPPPFVLSITIEVCQTNWTWGAAARSTLFTRNVWLYFIKAKVTSIQAWSKARITPLPVYFRSFTKWKKKSTSRFCNPASLWIPERIRPKLSLMTQFFLVTLMNRMKLEIYVDQKETCFISFEANFRCRLRDVS